MPELLYDARLPMRKLFHMGYRRIRLETVSPETFAADKEIFILGTGPLALVRDLVDRLQRVNPAIGLHILSPGTHLNAIRSRCAHPVQLIPFPRSGPAQLEDLSKELLLLETHSIDHGIAVFNNHWGLGYGNVFKIMNALCPSDYYAFNCCRQFLRLNGHIVDQHRSGSDLCRHLSEWLWDQIPDRNTDR